MPEQESISFTEARCPVPLSHNEKIVMGHGSGGKMSHDLIRRLFYRCFNNPILSVGDDAGVLDLENGGKLAFCTDSHTVLPLFFPGGDIGKLAVCGTVNDLAMVGAIPKALTTAFILEEGLDMTVLADVVASMQSAAEEAAVQIVAGDTKVVEKGKTDGMFISTSGIGVIPPGRNISGRNAQPGDIIILTGTMGDHGIAVLSARGQLGFESEVKSDVAPLAKMIEDVLRASSQVHVLRDPTRGGVATTLNEIAQQSNVGMVLQEGKLPIRPSVQAACEMLGFDALYLANEGKAIIIVGKEDAERVLEALSLSPYGKEAVIIGEVVKNPVRRVLMKTAYKSTRIVDMLAGEILPRIC